MRLALHTVVVLFALVALFRLVWLPPQVGWIILWLYAWTTLERWAEGRSARLNGGRHGSSHR